MSASPQSATAAADLGVSQTIPHPQYFIPTGDTDFLVQTVLFRVHRYFFERESHIFKNTFSEGEGKPYRLDVTADDFAHLLWVIYDEEYDYDNQPLDRWLVILRLATRWDFQKMRKLAVRQLEKIKLKPIDKIKIYSDFKIDAQLLIPSYTVLATSPTVPSLGEAQKLDIETILRLMTVRERALQKAAADGFDTPTSASIGDVEINKIICETFELPNVMTVSPNDPSNTGPSDDLNGATGNTVPTMQTPDKKSAQPNGKGANGKVHKKVNN